MEETNELSLVEYVGDFKKIRKLHFEVAAAVKTATNAFNKKIKETVSLQDLAKEGILEEFTNFGENLPKMIRFAAMGYSFCIKWRPFLFREVSMNPEEESIVNKINKKMSEIIIPDVILFSDMVMRALGVSAKIVVLCKNQIKY